MAEMENMYQHRSADDSRYAFKGVANAGLTTGIIGTALGVLNGGGFNLFGNMANANNANCCSDNHMVNRYELGKEQQIAKLETENSLLKSNIYTDQKISEVFERLSTRIRATEDGLAQQAVYNATNTSTIGCIQGQIAELMSMTKLVIPSGNICPQPMPMYNSWTAPSAPTTTT